MSDLIVTWTYTRSCALVAAIILLTGILSWQKNSAWRVRTSDPPGWKAYAYPSRVILLQTSITFTPLFRMTKAYLKGYWTEKTTGTGTGTFWPALEPWNQLFFSFSFLFSFFIFLLPPILNFEVDFCPLIKVLKIFAEISCIILSIKKLWPKFKEICGIFILAKIPPNLKVEVRFLST